MKSLKMNLKIVLKKKISFNKENHSIFQLDNELESSIFENMKPELTSFINSKFIEKIKIDKIVNLVEKPKTIYTNQDKYEYLSKKNKNLIDLVCVLSKSQKFLLDIMFYSPANYFYKLFLMQGLGSHIYLQITNYLI